jgi:hypothetical protein
MRALLEDNRTLLEIVWSTERKQITADSAACSLHTKPHVKHGSTLVDIYYKPRLERLRAAAEPQEWQAAPNISHSRTTGSA